MLIWALRRPEPSGRARCLVAAGARQLLGGSSLANAAFRVFPDKQSQKSRPCTSDATLRISGRSSRTAPQSLPARLKPESPRSWSISVAARWPVSRAVDTDHVEVGPEPLSVNRQSTRECLIAAHIGSWASLWALTSHSASLTDHPRSVMSPQTTWCLPASRAVATFQAVESRLPERPGDCPRVVTLTRGPRR
jgi:hypothetical protein